MLYTCNSQYRLLGLSSAKPNPLDRKAIPAWHAGRKEKINVYPSPFTKYASH